MPKKKINIFIQARNAMAAGLKSAGQSLKTFGRGVANVGKALTGAFVAAGAAMVLAARRAEEFNVQVAQIATIASVSTSRVKKEIRGMSAEFGLAKDELTTGLYNALSAGIPKDNAFEFMKIAAKTAKAGAASTAESVDLLTTALNAFGKPASEAEAVSDSLFTAVRLGKTTIGELGASFAKVAPLAAASGVAMDQVLAGVATLTKQGTPTAEAMTQIRAAIKAANDVLGDGWSKTMSLQGAMQKMSDAAGGSTSAIVKMTGRVEGAMAVLGMTGQNAQGAADDLAEVTKSAGAMGNAFKEVEDATPLAKIRQALDNMVVTAGDVALKALGPLILKAANAAALFADKIAEWSDTGVLLAGWEGFFESLRHGFNLASAWANVAGASIVDGFQTAWLKVKGLFTGEEAETVSKRTVAAMAVLESEQVRHASKLVAITRKQVATQAKAIEEAAAQEVAAVEEKINKIDAADQARVAKKKKLLAEEAKLVKQLTKLELDEKKQLAKAGIRELEKVQAKRKALAEKTVDDVLAEQAAQDAATKAQARNMKKAEELRARQERGVKLGKKQQAFLDAFDAIAAAQAGLGGGANAIQNAQNALKAMGDQTQKLTDIEGQLIKNQAQMNALLKRK